MPAIVGNIDAGALRGSDDRVTRLEGYFQVV
jgi:hypothetical protein